MPKPKIFLGHSAKEDTTRSLVWAIAGRLTAAGFEVQWDQDDARLQPGSSWRQEIGSWIVGRHAAIVVFSPARWSRRACTRR